MSFDHILLLALIQGATEFLPVSSSGHLALFPHLTAHADHGVVLDVALHFGTLLAVMVYFRRDCIALMRGGVRVFSGATDNEVQAARFVAIASLPILLGGAILVVADAHHYLRTPSIIGWASILFAVPLYLADRFGGRDATLPLGSRGAFVMGVAQVFALIPGASRSGVCITAARAFGLKREDAARLSMVLAIPVILAFTAAGVLEMLRDGDWQALRFAAVAALAAALIAMASIHLFLKMTRHLSLLPFVVYRVALGLYLITLL